MYVYQIKSYADIYSIAQRFLTIKTIGDKDFSRIFNFSNNVSASNIILLANVAM